MLSRIMYNTIALTSHTTRQTCSACKSALPNEMTSVAPCTQRTDHIHVSALCCPAVAYTAHILRTWGSSTLTV